MTTQEYTRVTGDWWKAKHSPIDWRIRLILFAFSVVAGAIHLLVAPEHFGHWWGYGVFFALGGALQIVYGCLWLVLPAEAFVTRTLPMLGIATNLALLALYVVSRTAGVPFFGPHAGEVESLGTIDGLSKAVEFLLTVLLILVLRQDGQSRALESRAQSMDPRSLVGTGLALLAAAGIFAYAVSQSGAPSGDWDKSDPTLSASGRTAPAAPVAGEPAARGTTASPAGAAAATKGSGRVALAVNELGILRPFGNGDQVLTNGPFALRIRFDPYPPTGIADLDVTVVDAEDDQAIADAAVTLRFDMPGHGHGVTPVRTQNRGDGHYGTQVNLNMGGDWTFDVDVRHGGQRGTLNMFVSSQGD